MKTKKKGWNRSLFVYFPVIGALINRIDREIAQHGINLALKKAIDRSRSRIKLEGMTKTVKKILTDQPVIVISNHLYFSDPMIIVSILPTRRSTFAVANSFFLGLGMNIDYHILPIFMHHYWTETGSRLSRWLMQVVYFFSRQPTHSFAINHALNQETINQATNLLTRNALIIFFPEDRKHQRWFKGIGHLVKKTNSLPHHQPVYLVFIKLTGISKWDCLRLLPGLGKWLPKISLKIIHHFPLVKLKSQEADSITRWLEKQYYHFFSQH